MTICVNCDQPFDPQRSNWLCYNCGFKNHCCEGAPACVRQPVEMTVGRHVTTVEYRRVGVSEKRPDTQV